MPEPDLAVLIIKKHSLELEVQKPFFRFSIGSLNLNTKNFLGKRLLSKTKKYLLKRLDL